MENHLDNLDEVCDLLKQGKVILCPTDTIWGLSCDAMNEKAVNRIFEIKKRDRHKKMILLVDTIKTLKTYIESIHPRIETLIYHHRRPVSVIYKGNKKIPHYLLTDDKTIAIRVVRDETLKLVISQLGKPIVSTSANVQGEPAPANYEDIEGQILKSVDYTFRAGRSTDNNGKSSMLISYNEEGELFFIRE